MLGEVLGEGYVTITSRVYVSPLQRQISYCRLPPLQQLSCFVEMVGFQDWYSASKALKFMLVCCVFGIQKFGFCINNKVTLEKLNIDVVLPCPGATDWYDPFGIPITESEKFIFSPGNLTITRVGEKDLGIYYCRKDNNQTVELHAKPYIKPLDKSYNVVQGQTINVECVAIAFPKAVYAWYRIENGEKRNMSNEARLIIENSSKDDYGIYKCEATNIHGNSSSVTKIRVKDKLAPLWPLIGIIIEVVILVVIIIIYERKKSKREREENMKEQVQKSGENNASGVRQRK